ncbi:MAG: MgtC/SapB family protein [Novosphingobium sp.]|nr:MgtC/SapB family protein [Novosphingobium sp.]MCP5403196.1 MgtC/SapB family protein [Novosphingobium sp.]
MDTAGLTDTLDWMGLALALGLGLLVGVERGWAHREEAPGTRFAGVRTFGLFGLAGGIAGALFAVSPTIATLVLAACAGLILVGYYRMSQDSHTISGTTSLGGIITVACGFLAATGEHLLAIAIAVSMVLLLVMRSQLHRLIGRMSEQEVTAIARFALIALVILPLLPDRAYGPYEAWNPHQLWLVVVLVSGLSLAGYVAGKVLGPSRGTLATAAAGALVSSTAVTASLSTQLKNGDANAALIHSAISTASAVMFARIMVVVGVIAPFALTIVAIFAIPGVLVSLAAAIWLLQKARRKPIEKHHGVDVKNPAAIGPALVLVGLVMVMTLVARWMLARYGDTEAAVALAISGTVDVDSAVIALGSLPQGTFQPNVAGLVLLAPTVLNTLFKAGVSISIAGWRHAWPGAAVLAVSALASLGALPFLL